MYFVQRDIDRFNSKIDKSNPDGCWEWTASQNRFGYGRIMLGGKVELAHRVAYMIYAGEIPNGMCVLHSCDNRRCCNPSHLWLGTQQDNIADMEGKGRAKRLRGAQHGMSKTTDDDVAAIRKGRADGKVLRELSEQYKLSVSTIFSICKMETWTHVR